MKKPRRLTGPQFSGKKLKALRGDQRIETVASELHVSFATLRNWEEGRTEPLASQAAAIAACYGKPIAYFFEGE